MVDRGLQQFQLAQKSGVHRSTLSTIIAEKRGVSPDVQERLEDALGLPRGGLMTSVAHSSPPAPREPLASAIGKMTLEEFLQRAKDDL
jgi:transcriptional regulator with XRE-family HTH domain